jgi:hypothetical protein
MQPSPFPSAARHQQSKRHLRPPRARKGRWMVDEYPAGYVAQLARPRSATGGGARRLAPPPAESASELRPAA